MEFAKNGIIFYLFSCSLVMSFDDVKTNNFKNILSLKKNSNEAYANAIQDLIARIIGDYHDPNDFVVVINDNFDLEKDTFQVQLTLLYQKLNIFGLT